MRYGMKASIITTTSVSTVLMRKLLHWSWTSISLIWIRMGLSASSCSSPCHLMISLIPSLLYHTCFLNFTVTSPVHYQNNVLEADFWIISLSLVLFDVFLRKSGIAFVSGIISYSSKFEAPAMPLLMCVVFFILKLW